MATWRLTPSPARATVVLLSLLSVALVCHGKKISESEFTDLQIGKRLPSTTYMSIANRGVIWCARQCRTRGRCRSFHYHLASLTCHLNENAASGGMALVDDDEFLYGEGNEDGIDDLVGDCATHDCQSDEKCVTDAANDPRCFPARCPSEIPNVNNSLSMEMDTEEVGGAAVFECEPDYSVLASSVSLACLTSGQWLDPRFVTGCEGECGRVPGIRAAWPGPASSKVGTTFKYHCYSGYRTEGSIREITCLANLTWTLADMRCTACNETLPTIPNSRVTHPVNRLGYNARYDCDPGYLMNGTGLLLCRKGDAEWDSVGFTCDKVNFTESMFGSEGALVSRDYPDPYPNDEDVVINVTLPTPGHNVSVSVWYEIQSSENCTSDYLIIGDNDNKYCGNAYKSLIVEVLTSSFNVSFVSDCCGQAKGFLLKYKVI